MKIAIIVVADRPGLYSTAILLESGGRIAEITARKAQSAPSGARPRLWQLPDATSGTISGIRDSALTPAASPHQQKSRLLQGEIVSPCTLAASVRLVGGNGFCGCSRRSLALILQGGRANSASP